MEKDIRQMSMTERFKYLNQKKTNMFNKKNKNNETKKTQTVQVKARPQR